MKHKLTLRLQAFRKAENLSEVTAAPSDLGPCRNIDRLNCDAVFLRSGERGDSMRIEASRISKILFRLSLGCIYPYFWLVDFNHK